MSTAGRTQEAHLGGLVGLEGLVKGLFKAQQINLSQGRGVESRARADGGQTPGQRGRDALRSRRRRIHSKSGGRRATGRSIARWPSYSLAWANS